MPRMTQKRILAWDRRNAAVHEAGHHVMAQLCGIEPVAAWIEPTETPRKNEKLWIGHFQSKTPSRSSPRSIPRLTRITKLVAVAGSVAEYCWRGEEVDPDYWWMFPEIMSPADWREAGCNPGQPDDACFRAIDRAGELLSRNGLLWDDLVSTARQLIYESRELQKLLAGMSNSGTQSSADWMKQI